MGTRKGLFLLRGDGTRTRWTPEGHALEGWSVNQAVADPRDGTLYACANGSIHGGCVQLSEDGGQTWERAEAPRLPEESGLKLAATWHLEPVHASQPGTLWLGGDSGSFFARTTAAARGRSSTASSATARPSATLRPRSRPPRRF